MACSRTDRASPGALTGLDDAEARARLAHDGPNLLPAPAGSGPFAQAWRQLATEPMFLLLLAAAALYLLIGDLAEGALLGAFALVTVVLVLAQNRRSRRALDALRALAAPQARVLRSGAARRLPAAEVVRGDALLLEEGERVAADAVLREASALAVDESLLTGESVPVDKAAGDRMFAGTLVVGGHGVAEVQAVGAATEAGRIGALLGTLDDTPTRLQRSTARLVRVLGGLAAVVSVALTGLVVLRGGSWTDGVLAGIALAMSMLPEEFALAMAVFFAIGAWRLAQERVLTRRSAVIETLGAATVLAVDKTGTLTENRMRVRHARSAGGTWDAAGDAPPGAPVHELLRAAVRATREHTPDPLDRALRALAGDGALAAPPTRSLRHEWPLATGRPLYVAVWPAPEGPQLEACCKGAAEAVLALCTLDTVTRSHWHEQAARLAADGLRVLGVARARPAADAPLPGAPQAWRFEWLGLVAFEDPLRAGVPAAVREAHAAGLRVLMITGDAPGTALAIARQAGLVDGRERESGALTGRDIDALDDTALSAAVQRCSVFARVDPQHKLRLVRALQSNGAVVAMTGDGVNDAPALRAAHVGIGMGARGTDVAREAAALVLLDDDFAHIVSAVALGRRIFDNLRKVMLYIVGIHVPIGGLALLPLLMGLPPVLLPAHVALVEMVIDPMCTLGYEGLRAEPGQMRQPPRPLDEPLIGWPQIALGLAQGMSLLAGSLAVYLVALQQAHAPEAARFLAFAALTAGNLVLALVNTTQRPFVRGLEVARPFLLITLAAAAALALCLATPWTRALFGFAWPGGGDLALALGAGALSTLLWDLAKFAPPIART
ncbi:MAG TPA: HAD-IC family P-type ATPase, partial [Burkholderiaceae bacterium]|nr:HAD-IC family P-type ATPase [Burkholderiaceae bacterium]